VPDVWPHTREQRGWFHILGNILDKLPTRRQSVVEAALHEVIYAETRGRNREVVTRFAAEYRPDEPEYPKALTILEEDANLLLTFLDFLAVALTHVERESSRCSRW
jgi:transposase-like protein